MLFHQNLGILQNLIRYPHIDPPLPLGQVHTRRQKKQWCNLRRLLRVQSGNSHHRSPTSTNTRTSSGCRTCLLLPRLLFPLGPVSRLQRPHALFANIGVPPVEGFQVCWLDNGGQLDLFCPLVLALGVGGADENRERGGRVEVGERVGIRGLGRCAVGYCGRG